MADNVLCFGEALWDCLPDSRHIGGAPLNAAYHLSRLGCSAWPVSSVGDDPAGHELLDCLMAWGIPTDLIGTRPDKQTGIVEVSIQRGSPTYCIAEDVAWDYIDLPDSLPDSCQPVDAVVFGSLAQRTAFNREALRRLCEAVPEALRVFDVNIRPPFDSADRIRALAQEANLIKLNDEEAAIMLGQSEVPIDIEASARELHAQTGCDRICITAGSAGAGFLNLGTWHWVDAERVRARDTVGAGDAFLAALVHGLLVSPGMPEAVLRRAAILASFVVGSDGATPQYTIGEVF
jgi:fructokinase